METITNVSRKTMKLAFEQSITAFRNEDPVLIYDADDREGEIDLTYPASAVTPEVVTRLRYDAGGFVCVALSNRIAEQFDLPFLQEAVDHPASENPEFGYDDRSSFSITVDHVETHTGITDNDRSLTIQALGQAAASPDTVTFGDEFRSPGHVHLLRAALNLLDDRRGHTELAVALADAADVVPAIVVCEMIDDNGGAVSFADAKDYAIENDIPVLTSDSIAEHV